MRCAIAAILARNATPHLFRVIGGYKLPGELEALAFTVISFSGHRYGALLSRVSPSNIGQIP